MTVATPSRRPLIVGSLASGAAMLSAMTLAIALGGAGCSTVHERNAAIPDMAVLKVQGSGDAVTYTPETRGTVYVYDATDDQVLWAGDVRDHADVTVDTRENVVRADGRIVRQRGTFYGHQYRIFFQPAL